MTAKYGTGPGWEQVRRLEDATTLAATAVGLGVSVEQLAHMDADGWQHLAALAEVDVPSMETIVLVLGIAGKMTAVAKAAAWRLDARAGVPRKPDSRRKVRRVRDHVAELLRQAS